MNDGLNLGRAQTAQRIQRQNDRLQLLLKLTNSITSNLELKEVLRAIAANVREVMHCDAVSISLKFPRLCGRFSRQQGICQGRTDHHSG